MKPARLRLSALVLVLVQAGCGAGATGAGSVVPTTVSGPAAPSYPPGVPDGSYQGTRTPEVGNPACGFVAAIGFDVHGTTIQLRTHKLRRALGGMIERNGRFTMTSTDGTQQLVGAIQDTSLTATETTPPRRHRHDAGEPVPGGLCIAHIVATRVASAS